MKVPFRERSYPNRGLTISLVLLLLATIGSAAFLMYTLVSQRTFVRQGTEGVQVTYLLQDLLTQLRTAESSVRGYYLTGDETYLEDYETARQRVPAYLRRIGTIESAQAQGPRLAELDGSVTNRMNQLQTGVERRRSQGRDLFIATAQFSTGKQSMDQTQRLLSAISRDVLRAVAPSQRRAETALRRSLILAPVLAAVVIALCIVITRFFRTGIERERSIEGSKNEFLSLASHQLRTPATNVKQYIHLVTDGYFGPISKEQQEALEVASKNNDIEISIINDLLDVAKIDLDQIGIDPEAADAGKLVRQVIKEFRPVTRRRKQPLSYREPKGMPAVALDKTYFKTVVENLIDNASKYSPPHSPIRLEAVTEAKRYVLTVHDQGVGISKQDQAKLFKKFSRIPNPLSEAVEGSGLGLYWAKRVVELHGGSIRVRSKPGAGTDFVISLPLAGEPAVKRRSAVRPA